eukprot:CAMPEP_0197527326 /NCGR_PEP_ID=MMETSP1318-20131121/21102_1 /TAXON_ID=552666 /ORGANISM="Partenskyella glossopodia, Strain RCC365" /LENGTH=600 /DNA_ID=CAMNT_0043081897 /DNA_START=51 /DNA_END=1850 /DNA_ORIENTATION=-
MPPKSEKLFKRKADGSKRLLTDILNDNVVIAGDDDGKEAAHKAESSHDKAEIMDAKNTEISDSKEIEQIASGAMAEQLSKEDVKTLENRLKALSTTWEKARLNFEASAREIKSQLEFAKRDEEAKKLDPKATSSNSKDSSTKDSKATEADDDDFEAVVTVDDTQLLERSKYIPLRLTLEERKFLRLITSTLEVSEYTDRVDIARYSGRAKRIYAQLKEICAILSGLLVACDYKAGQKLVANDEFAENEEFFQYMFELGRRYKILNPERMRSAYGKLIYLLQDSQAEEIREMMEFSLVRPLQSVHVFLSEKKMLRMLSDPLVHAATRTISQRGKSRPEVQYELQKKRRAYNRVKDKYIGEGGMSEQDCELVMGSIADNNYFLQFNRDPCDEMIEFLKTKFDPDTVDGNYSLSIGYGSGGARLSHNHKTQYYFVMQTLMLWRDILHDFYRLWFLAEDDLLNPNNAYRLRNTGQGLNRIQSSPNIAREMSRIIHTARTKVGYWIGSSVVHLGDHNVPNAFMFIDKYTQISRILNPICITLRRLEEIISEKPGLQKYVDDTFGGCEALRMRILCDFFRHGFDGSGADNFFDAGSCIDGRLTSAW